MTIYVTHFTSDAYGTKMQHVFNSWHGHSCGMQGHYVEGRGLPIDIARKITAAWTENNKPYKYTVVEPVPQRDEEL